MLDLRGTYQIKKFRERFIKTVKFNPLGRQGMILHVRDIFKDLYQVYQIPDFYNLSFDLAGFTQCIVSPLFALTRSRTP